MKRLALAVVLSLALAPAAYAKDAKAPTAQQEKMKKCNADASAKALKGDERKKFMSECLGGEAPAAEKKLSPQQEKMKKCNADATEKKLKGKERKDFMSSCLKG